jgi:probable rRNA maturation factor
MISVNVISENNLWNKKIKNLNNFFNQIIKFFPKKYRFINKKVSLTVLLSDNHNIKKLNKKFRNKNEFTDVLSFPFEKNSNIKKNRYLGDIIISYEFMNKPKKSTNLEFKKRVLKTFIHSFLHLLGYDHIKLKDFQEMLIEEVKIYKFTNIKIINLV